jgi:hypothetical protein
MAAQAWQWLTGGVACTCCLTCCVVARGSTGNRHAARPAHAGGRLDVTCGSAFQGQAPHEQGQLLGQLHSSLRGSKGRKVSRRVQGASGSMPSLQPCAECPHPAAA